MKFTIYYLFIKNCVAIGMEMYIAEAINQVIIFVSAVKVHNIFIHGASTADQSDCITI